MALKVLRQMHVFTCHILIVESHDPLKIILSSLLKRHLMLPSCPFKVFEQTNSFSFRVHILMVLSCEPLAICESDKHMRHLMVRR